MAIGGKRRTPTVLRLITGNPGGHPIPQGEPMPAGAVERPTNLRGNVAKLWDKYIARAFWLTWADGPKALLWCHMQAEFERAPTKMIASRIAQLRALGSELGLDPSSRARLGANAGAKRPPGSGDNGKPQDPASKYLG